MPEKLHLLLADNDIDDRFFFDRTLKALPFDIRLTTVDDGQHLMDFLFENARQLPDVLFLDLNMPRKNGSDCLTEIKQSEMLQHLPVIIYSTSLHEDVANQLYTAGAHYYMRKAGLTELEETLLKILGPLKENNFARPVRNGFILSMLAI